MSATILSQVIPQSYKILLIEDNEGDAFLTRKAFDIAGIRSDVVVAEDGDQALQILRRDRGESDYFRPDLILLDMNLPKKSGLDVLKDIKSDPGLKQIPVIVLSSSRAERDVMSSYSLHGNGYILKPHGVKQFGEVVAAIESFWFRTAILPPAQA